MYILYEIQSDVKYSAVWCAIQSNRLYSFYTWVSPLLPWLIAALDDMMDGETCIMRFTFVALADHCFQ